MRNPSAYVPNFLNFQICCILSKFENFICAKIFDFKFSHRRESTRRGKFYRRGGVRRRRASLFCKAFFEQQDSVLLLLSLGVCFASCYIPVEPYRHSLRTLRQVGAENVYTREAPRVFSVLFHFWSLNFLARALNIVANIK